MTEDDSQHKVKATTLHSKEFEAMGANGETLRESTLLNVQTTSCSLQYFPHSAVDKPTRRLTGTLTNRRQCKHWSGQGSFCRAAGGPKAMEE